MERFDLIVIGGGSGGLAAAQRAAEYGARAVVFENDRLGGTCVNVGCVPKKVMWNAAEIANALNHAGEYGFEIKRGGHDFSALKRGRDAYIERLNGIYARNLDRKDVAVVRSTARFTGRREITDAQGRTYAADHIIVATGGYPRRPQIPGGDLGLTSDGFFDMADLPAKAAVVGSGYIAVELVGVLQALGSQVTLFMRFDRVLRQFDRLLSDTLMTGLADAGVELVTGAVPSGVETEGGLVLATEAAGRHGPFDELIWAIGRSPNTANLGLDATDVTVTPNGYIEVDEFQNTTANGIYAIGDVTGGPELTPVAIAAGRRLCDRLFNGQTDRRLSVEIVPTVVFSHPPIATIGLSEAQARVAHGDESIRTYVSEFVPMFNALSEHKPRSAMKLVCAGPDERIVGCHVIGPGADEMAQGFAVAITMGARKRDFDDTIAIHPTSAEELVTMR